ncbi:glycoside hydrolase family 15 protein [Rubrobacter indicoceani]|uniref:glycoside hydrolase family 15 protein n=1 Tax=Rubrobacter indicoceani TaxID=2051957 RepID=UPI000E5A4367|nr:glycoside hydrolase family 15 protein [Rubrobacter indicoceani]
MKSTAGKARLSAVLGFAGVLLLACAPISTPAASRYPDPVPLRTSGLTGSGDAVFSISPERAEGAEYLPNSTVLKLADDGLIYVPEGADAPVSIYPGDKAGRNSALAAAAEDRRWLEAGVVPGRDRFERDIAARSLLNLRLLTLDNGASLAAIDENWDYVWPRDASWTAAAFAATGHGEESRDILEFLARTQGGDGTWQARYYPGGRPVGDGRAYQLDASGWFPWAVRFHAKSGGEGIEKLWPAVERAADASAASLGRDGLPPGGADYWEIRTARPNLGTSAALLAGLRSAAEIARELGHREKAARYAGAASILAGAVEREFAPNGYTRTPWPTSGRDAAVTFLAPPFAPYDQDVRDELRRTESVLRAPNGGLLPGERWSQEPTVSWTAESAFFMLAASATDDRKRADRWLRWLAAHRTELGAFPEKVDADGSPKAAAPLAWTDAAVVLALAAGEGRLPPPPG